MQYSRDSVDCVSVFHAVSGGIFPYWRGLLVMVGGYAILKGTVLTVLVYSMQ